MPQRFPNGRVLDVVDRRDSFCLGVHDPMLVVEKVRKLPTGQVTIVIDRGRKDGAAVVFEPLGKVGAPSKEGDPKRSPRDNHRWSYLHMSVSWQPELVIHIADHRGTASQQGLNLRARHLQLSSLLCSVLSGPSGRAHPRIASVRGTTLWPPSAMALASTFWWKPIGCFAAR